MPTLSDSSPLRGFTVGVTADRRWEEQAELLLRRGATVMHGPTIRTLPLGAEAPLREATELLLANPPDYLIANTAVGMRAWFAQVETWGLDAELHTVLSKSRIFARGPKAAGAIAAASLEVTVRAPSERLDEVLELLLAEPVQGKTIAFQMHGELAPRVTAVCEEAGARVIEVPVYSWKIPSDTSPAERLIDHIVSRRVHAVTFTSAPAVLNLMQIADERDLRDGVIAAFNDSVLPVCVGSVCAESATDVGVERPVMPDRARLGPMIRTLADELVGGSRGLYIDGREVELRGMVVVVDGTCTELSERESAVMSVLVSRCGTVVPRSALLHAIWGRNADPHLLEVTIARLRKRLGVLGEAIQTVPRRGYLLRIDAVQR